MTCELSTASSAEVWLVKHTLIISEGESGRCSRLLSLHADDVECIPELYRVSNSPTRERYAFLPADCAVSCPARTGPARVALQATSGFRVASGRPLPTGKDCSIQRVCRDGRDDMRGNSYAACTATQTARYILVVFGSSLTVTQQIRCKLETPNISSRGAQQPCFRVAAHRQPGLLHVTNSATIWCSPSHRI